MTKFGIFLINKPVGITSHDVVDYLRKVANEKTIGHAGTLDPLASGLMIVAIGREFTKRISEFSKLDKEYNATATLGATSTTYDAEGKITSLSCHPKLSLRHPELTTNSLCRHPGLRQPSEARRAKDGSRIVYDSGVASEAPQNDEIVEPQREEIEKILKNFIGEQEQMPPIFSAKKISGQKAYDLARQGKEVVLKPVKINIYKIELLNYQYPILKFSVKVSSGTYIRSLVNDLGQKLDVGAYMSGLVRTAIGKYNLLQAQDLHQIKSVADLYPHQLPLI